MMENKHKMTNFAPLYKNFINIYKIFNRKSLVNESDLHLW